MVSEAGERDRLQRDGAPVARFVLEAALAVRERRVHVARLQTQLREENPGRRCARQVLRHPGGMLGCGGDVALAP